MGKKVKYIKSLLAMHDMQRKCSNIKYRILENVGAYISGCDSGYEPSISEFDFEASDVTGFGTQGLDPEARCTVMNGFRNMRCKYMEPKEFEACIAKVEQQLRETKKKHNVQVHVKVNVSKNSKQVTEKLLPVTLEKADKILTGLRQNLKG